MVGCWSFHSPEKGASSGLDQPWPCRCEIRIAEELPEPLAKTTLWPSGVKAGAASWAGPEMTPGAKT